MSQKLSARRALVIGGSMAGLLAARVLADHFADVLVIERDRYPEGIAFRKGAPQARHVHTLLMRGQQILERLFPGLEADLAEAGAPALEWTSDALGWSALGWLPRFHSHLKAHTCSRELLEGTIRRRLAAFPNVRFLESNDVIGLLADEGNTGVAGVRVRARTGAAPGAPAEMLALREAGSEQDLLADFVVDASGRESKAAEWLEALGYARPEETRINAFLGYASRIYQRPASRKADWKAVLIGSMPPKTLRGGVIYPIEGDRWLVTLSGRSKQYPPTDEEGFLAFARQCANPLIYESIKDATPLSPIYGYRRTENHLRHYERLERFPERFVALGDAVCAFNPVYGQGMTTAALGAETLDTLLHQQRDSLTGLSKRFQKALAKVTATPWLMATGEDLRCPGVEGGQELQRSSAARRWLRGYLERVRLLAPRDPQVYLLFLEVAHLLRPPTAFFQPRVLAKVFWQCIHKGRKSAAAVS